MGPRNGKTTIEQEIINIGDGTPARLLPDEDPFDTPMRKPEPNKEQSKILEQLDDQQQQEAESTGHAPRQITSTTPIHMITFNANSLAINATQDIRDNIRRPNTAITITDTRMTKEKMIRYKRDAKNANKILIA